MKHGTNQGWLEGCRRECCKKGRYNYLQQRTKSYHSRGLKTEFDLTDVEPVRKHLRMLFRSGYTQQSVAKIAGLPYETVCNITRNTMGLKWVQYRTALKIMAVKPVPVWTQIWDLPDETKIPALGTRRRLRALAYLGYSAPDIASRLGKNTRVIRRARDGNKDTVLLWWARMIRDFYEWAVVRDLPEGPGASRMRSYARRMGWVGPGAWYDIDDPDSKVDRYVT